MKRFTRSNQKHTPYGYVRVNGEIICRKDTLAQAEQAAARARASFAAANLFPSVTVEPYNP